MKKEDMSCIDCAVKNCNKMDKTYPDFCLTTHMDEEVLNEAMECYNEDENRKVTIAAAEVEYENYCKHTRVEEIMDFAKKINAKKIGIATCVGLLKESRILADILRRHGFEVYGVGCKAGTQKKTSVGADAQHFLYHGVHIACSRTELIYDFIRFILDGPGLCYPVF